MTRTLTTLLLLLSMRLPPPGRGGHFYANASVVAVVAQVASGAHRRGGQFYANACVVEVDAADSVAALGPE